MPDDRTLRKPVWDHEGLHAREYAASAPTYDRVMLRLLPVCLVLLASTARADSVAYSCSAADNVKPIEKSGACIGFVANDAKGKEVQRVTGLPMISGSIHASADGSTVMVVHGYPLQARDFDSVPAVIVFRGNKEVARYTMKQLIERMELISMSVSHVSWIAEGPPRVLTGKTASLTTSSQRVHTFDLATGAKTSEDSKLWKECDAIVYIAETIKDPVAGVAVIPEPWVAKGSIASKRPLSVKLAPGVRARSGATLCLRSEKRSWTATANIDVMFNMLPR